MKGWFFCVLLVLTVLVKSFGEEDLRPLVEGFLKKAFPDVKVSFSWKGSYYDKALGLYVILLLTEDGKPVLLYVDRGKRYVFIGRIYELSTAQELSRGHYSKLSFGFSKKGVNTEELEVMGPVLGKGKKAILISSPNCPNCRKVVPKVIDKALAGRLSLYYKGIPFGQDHELEELAECLRGSHPGLFWEFIKRAYTQDKEKVLFWLRSALKEDPKKGCNLEEARTVLQRNFIEVLQKLKLEGIPALVLEGKLYEGVKEVQRALKRL